jgi:hypothetical protein
MIHEAVDYLVWGLGITVLLVVGYLVFDSTYPPKLLVFDDKMISISRDFTHSIETPQTFKPEDIVPLRLKGRRYTNEIPVILTHLINVADGSTVSIHSSENDTDPMAPAPRTGKGSFDFVSLSRKVARNCYAGVFYFENTYSYPARNFLCDRETYKIRTEPFRVVVPNNHDDTEDEAIIRRILKEMHIKSGATGQKGDKGDKGERGPGLFGK